MMVSVIIPAYNAEKYIERAVRSCLSQTYQDIEVIVVNDGSVDQTQNIAENIAEENAAVKVISVNNGGVSRARNIGLQNATGEFVTFLDADDELLTNGVEFMVSMIEKHGVDICSASFVRNKEEVIDQSGKIEVWSSRTAVEKALEDHPATYCVGAKVYRREKIGGILFPEGKRVHEDGFFVYSCFLAGLSVAVVDVPVYVYYSNSESVTHSPFSERIFDILELTDRKVRLTQEKFPEFAPKIKNMVLKANMTVLQNLCKTKDKKYKEIEKNCLRNVRRNKKYFISATPGNRLWFWIIVMRLYGLYKSIYRIRHHIR